jgi:hypothetical protein
VNSVSHSWSRSSDVDDTDWRSTAHQEALCGAGPPPCANMCGGPDHEQACSLRRRCPRRRHGRAIRSSTDPLENYQEARHLGPCSRHAKRHGSGRGHRDGTAFTRREPPGHDECNANGRAQLALLLLDSLALFNKRASYAISIPTPKTSGELTMLTTHLHPIPYQIDPSDGYAYYQILEGSNVLAEIVATRHADPSHGSGMAAGTEYWRVMNGALRTAHHPGLSVKRVRSGGWSVVGPPPFRAADASFHTPVGAIWSGHAMTNCHKASHSDDGFAVDVSLQGAHWRGTMKFYGSSTQAVFKSIANGSSEVFTLKTYQYPHSCVIHLP